MINCWIWKLNRFADWTTKRQKKTFQGKANVKASEKEVIDPVLSIELETSL